MSSSTAPPIDTRAIAELSATRSYTLGIPRAFRVLPDGGVLFLRTPPRSRAAELFELDAATATVRKLASESSLIAKGDSSLSVAEQARRERERIAISGIVDFQVSDDGKIVLIPVGSKLFALDRASGDVRSLELGEGAPDAPRLSRDGKRVAFVRDGDLWVATLGGAVPRRVTRREGASVSNGSAEFVAQEEFDRTEGYVWSPDGRALLYQRTDERDVDLLYVSDPRHPERAPIAFRYPRAGTHNADVRLGIVSAQGGKTQWVQWDRSALPYLYAMQWPTAAAPNLVVMNRAQTQAQLLRVDPVTGKTTTLLTESDSAWVNVRRPRFMADGQSFWWASEHSGHFQLEQRSAGDGSLLRSADIPGFGGDFQLDADSGEIWVTASVDPTESHVARLDPVSLALSPITSAPGVHSFVLAEHGGTRVLIQVGADGQRAWSAIRRDGSKLAELPSVAEEPARLPKVAFETVTAGGLDLHVAIVRPNAFDPTLRYPVLLQVYAGPSVTTVWNSPHNYFKDQLLADAGFIVVRADGRGTPRRGRAFERVISRDLISIPMADQVAALQAVGAAHPELDLTRAGVLGWSFGGYFAVMAVLMRPDVFAAAVAGAPVTDWRYYDTAYTERYMGLPSENEAGYAATSAVELASKLTRPLLLVHGMTDDNVYFVNTLALSEALFRAGKPHELLALSSTHMTTDPDAEAALLTREINFFRTHLGSPATAQPISQDPRGR